MDNKVVTTLTKIFQDMGLNTVRFNFRGVGRSEGQYDNGEGELNDLLAVIESVNRITHSRHLAGRFFLRRIHRCQKQHTDSHQKTCHHRATRAAFPHASITANHMSLGFSAR